MQHGPALLLIAQVDDADALIVIFPAGAVPGSQLQSAEHVDRTGNDALCVCYFIQDKSGTGIHCGAAGVCMPSIEYPGAALHHHGKRPRPLGAHDSFAFCVQLTNIVNQGDCGQHFRILPKSAGRFPQVQLIQRDVLQGKVTLHQP